jgi:hypothetical protein
MKAILTLVALSALLLTTAFAAKPYPFDYCVVTDNELGSMGKVITKVYGDQQIKFCCKPCVAKFEKNPAKYLAKLP